MIFLARYILRVFGLTGTIDEDEDREAEDIFRCNYNSVLDSSKLCFHHSSPHYNPGIKKHHRHRFDAINTVTTTPSSIIGISFTITLVL